MSKIDTPEGRARMMPASMVTQTPLTDANAGYDDNGLWKQFSTGAYVTADFARSLERILRGVVADKWWADHKRNASDRYYIYEFITAELAKLEAGK